MLRIVQPETVIRWHRRGFGYYWKTPPIGRDVIALIKRLSIENPLWGAPLPRVAHSS